MSEMTREEKEDATYYSISVDVVRALVDGTLNLDTMDEFITALDEAQGPVFMNNKERNFLIIEITK